MHFFLDLIRSKINKCVKEQGSADVQDFEFPPLPEMHNIDISKFKEIVLNRLLVRNMVQKCNETKGETAENNTIDCIATARAQYDQTICTTRLSCAKQTTDPKCKDRLDKVHAAICQCKISANAGELLMSGKLEKQYKKCHDDNNIPYPEEKVKKAHEAVVESAKALLSKHQKMPDQVKQTLQTARQAIGDIEAQWKNAFCADCSGGGANSTAISDSEVAYLKHAAFGRSP